MRDVYRRALRFRWLTRFYDPIFSSVLHEEQLRARLVEQVGVRPGHEVLDVGCGTGTLTILLSRACPAARIVGLDGDPEILELATAKARAAGTNVTFVEGLAQSPPFPPASFDRVVSCLMFHHLAPRAKRTAFERLHALLRPGGELHVADWGQARDAPMRLAYLGVQLLDGFESTSDNVHGLLVPMMELAGFVEVRETRHERTLFGTLSLYCARKDGAGRRE